MCVYYHVFSTIMNHAVHQFSQWLLLQHQGFSQRVIIKNNTVNTWEYRIH